MEKDSEELEGLNKAPFGWVISNTRNPDISKVVHASEILDKIKNGKEVNYDHVIIEDDIDIPKLDIKQKKLIDRTKFERKKLFLKDGISIITSAIQITNSKIKDNIDMSNIFFIKGVNFAGSKFDKDATFKGSFFNEDANFIESAFLKSANFKGSRFLGNAHFMRTSFYRYANFQGSQYIARADFEGSMFNEDAFFEHSTFGITTRFYESLFKGWAGFSSSRFFGDGIFSKAKFCWSADFTDTIFYNNLHFTESAIKGDIKFKKSHFNKDVLLWGTQIKGEVISFEQAKFNILKSQEYACRKAKKLLEDRGNRDLADYHFYREMEAKRKQKGSGFWPFDYESLVFYNGSNITTNGLNNITPCFKEIKSILTSYLKYDIFEYIVFEKVFGYGVHPYMIPLWWLVIAIAFGGVYYIFQGIDSANCFWQCMAYSFFIVFTKGGNGNYQPKPGFEWVVGLETFIGLIMFGAFLASITRKYMR